MDSRRTVASVIDIKSLRDIRKAIRRKYASRSNIERIFNQWDKDQKGYITIQDIFYAMNKLGIKTTLNEAKALHATAKQLDNDPNLTLPEFQSMLFSGDETVNLDSFRKLDAATNEDELANAEAFRRREANKVIDLASLPADHLEKFRQRNMYRLAL